MSSYFVSSGSYAQCCALSLTTRCVINTNCLGNVVSADDGNTWTWYACLRYNRQ